MRPRGTKERVRETRGVDDECPYLPGKRSTVRYRFIENCAPATYLEMLERGWRRFGPVFFRPVCAACSECHSLRVPVASFRPDRSQRRNLARNADLRLVVQAPTISQAHLDLYARYHADMETRRGWREKSDTALDYYMTFVEGHGEFGRELLSFEGERLLAVALVDVLPRALSAVYGFYEPSERGRGLGVHSILRQVAYARELGIPHLYLGFRVADNASMRYKADYRPHELLDGRPELGEEARWLPAASAPRRAPTVAPTPAVC